MKAKEAAIGRRDLLIADLDDVVIDDGFNVRVQGDEFWEGIDHLKDSLIANGMRRPVEAYFSGDKFHLVDGHRRITAARKAVEEGHDELRRIPVIIRDDYKNEIERVIALAVSNDGAPLAPIEKAEICRRLRSYNLSNSEIARRLGMSPASVGNLLELADAPVAIQQMVRSGEVGATTAVEALRRDEGNAADVLALAVESAKADGKKKATGNHVAEVREIVSAVGVPADGTVETHQHQSGLTFATGVKPGKRGRKAGVSYKAVAELFFRVLADIADDPELEIDTIRQEARENIEAYRAIFSGENGGGGDRDQSPADEAA
jgi:ParB/RepB/Spo0J family partition protein